MTKYFKKIVFAVLLFVLFYFTLAYELTGTPKCNIFNPAYYVNIESIFKILFSVAVILCVICFSLLVQSKYFRNSNLLNLLFSERAFLLFMIFAGIIVSLVIPLCQIPDENTHITMIYEELGLDADYSTYFGKFAEPMSWIFNADLKVNLDTYFNNGVVLNVPKLISCCSLAIIKHLPQAIGLLLCSIFNCSLFVTSVVCESSAVIFSSVVCYFALKLMPTRKLLFASIMALPLCLQQNGSFSYDAVLMPLCFLLFAYLLNIKFVKEKFQTRDMLLILLISLCITIIKMPYVLIAAIIFLIPSQKFSFKIFKWTFNHESWDKYKKIILPAFVLLCILAGLGVLSMFKGNGFINLFIVSIINFVHSLKLIARFIIFDLCRIWSSYIWDFCWLNISPSVYFLLFIIASLFVFNFIQRKNKNKSIFKFREHLFILIIFAAIFYVVTISLVEHTLYLRDIFINNLSLEELSQNFLSVDRILGLQGRYYIPIVPLLCYSFRSNTLTKMFDKVNYKLYSPIYFASVFIYVVFVIVARYWA